MTAWLRGAAVLVCLMLAGVAVADHIADGVLSSGEWPPTTFVGSDTREATINDEWDVMDVWMDVSSGSQQDTIWLAWKALDSLVIDNESGLYVECIISFDRDEDGYADSRLRWSYSDDYMPAFSTVYAETCANVPPWTINGYGAVAWQDSAVEFCVRRDAMGFKPGALPPDHCVPLYLIFDNGNTGSGSEDDRFPDQGIGWTEYCDPDVPVELTSFHAWPVHGQVELRWETASETDNLGFLIYRSAGDGWSLVTRALIEARGSDAGGASYSYVDREVEPGTTYWYRLVDISTGGVETSHGPVQAVIPSAPVRVSVEVPTPNPVREASEIGYTITASGTASLVLYDCAGRAREVLVEGSVETGSHTVTLGRVAADGTRLPAGLYLLRLVCPSGAASRRIIIAD
jgi:hypothetical protein